MSTVSVASWEEAELTMPAEPGAPQATAAIAAAAAVTAPWRAPTLETARVAPRESREEEEARPLSTSTPKPSAWGSSLGAHDGAGTSPDTTWRKQLPAGAWGGRAGAVVGASSAGGGRGAGAAGTSADESQAMLDRLIQFKSSGQRIKQQTSAAGTVLGELRHLDALPAPLCHGSLLHSQPPLTGTTVSSGPLSPGAKAGSGGLEAASISSHLRMSAASSTTATSTSSSASSLHASSTTPTPASSTSSSATPLTHAAAPTGTGAGAVPLAPSWAAVSLHLSIEAAHSDEIEDEIREPLTKPGDCDEIEDEIREPLQGPDTPHPRHSPPLNFPLSMKLPPAAKPVAPTPGARRSAPAVGASASAAAAAAAAAGPRPPLSATVTDELAVFAVPSVPATTTPTTTPPATTLHTGTAPALDLVDLASETMPDENDAGASVATSPPATTPPRPPVVLKIIVPPSSRSLITGELPRYDGAHAAWAAAQLAAALAELLQSTSAPAAAEEAAAPEEAAAEEEAAAAEAAAAGSVRSDANEYLASPLGGDFVARVAAAAAAEAVDALVEELELAETASMRTLSMDDFVLLRLVGKGGYGKVFQVRCHLNHQIYAMKVVDKASVERYRSMENIAIELSILRQHAEARHPFILGLECAFQSASKLHFVMEYVPGGMLFAHLRAHEMFSEKMARFYAAEVIVTLEHPHDLPS